MDNKALYVCNVSKEREDRKTVDELICFFLAALDIECEDRAAAVREILLVKIMLGVIRERRMVELSNLRVIREELYYLLGILNMTLKS